ncbi:MAG: AFG1/ZapE family ATPase, partial [Hyphomicrobiales bacterium]|nr:AFG1/ZapE family ATPase [Hyphomicrobiales bacterium]
MGAALTQVYDARIASGELADDAAQRQVAERLEQLAIALGGYAPKVEGGLLDKLFGKPQKIDPPVGVYIHGHVGRGKTMLMDLLFDA